MSAPTTSTRPIAAAASSSNSRSTIPASSPCRGPRPSPTCRRETRNGKSAPAPKTSDITTPARPSITPTRPPALRPPTNPISEGTIAMIRHALATISLALAALGLSSSLAQTPPNTVALQPSPDIPGVIAGGTMPEVVIKGLTSSDDPFWLPGVGLIFSESQANRIVKLDEHDQPVTFVDNLLNPLGMTYDAKNGELISIQTKPGSMGPRVV